MTITRTESASQVTTNRGIKDSTLLHHIPAIRTDSHMVAVVEAEEAFLEADPQVVSAVDFHVGRPDLQRTQATLMENGAVRTGEMGEVTLRVHGPGMAKAFTRRRCSTI